ncbi:MULTISPECIES: hypothetical protein [Pseudomonas]|uniref:hypothetical protein n=1 Tax=Pseudomonas TaxID=286 RepID=UPI00111C33AE|nr:MULTISPECIES: hypothetical protein [Pseudomonas]MCX4221031.1 hypothetical protein [Pseudomonas sp. MCal1]UDI94186.1 hypothetical protein I5961_06510 [Pseudomonas sp. IAC-BECa141]UIN52486.1 hypothetical protein LXN51_15895 [Pseudomonas kribbensis]
MNSSKQPVGSMTVQHHIGGQVVTLHTTSFRFFPKGEKFALLAYFGNDGEEAPVLQLKCSSKLTTGTYPIEIKESESTVSATWGVGTLEGLFGVRGTGEIELKKFSSSLTANLIEGSLSFRIKESGVPEEQKVVVEEFKVEEK